MTGNDLTCKQLSEFYSTLVASCQFVGKNDVKQPRAAKRRRVLDAAQPDANTHLCHNDPLQPRECHSARAFPSLDGELLSQAASVLIVIELAGACCMVHEAALHDCDFIHVCRPPSWPVHVRSLRQLPLLQMLMHTP